MNDKGLLWKQYEKHIDPYCYYLNLFFIFIGISAIRYRHVQAVEFLNHRDC